MNCVPLVLMLALTPPPDGAVPAGSAEVVAPPVSTPGEEQPTASPIGDAARSDQRPVQFGDLPGGATTPGASPSGVASTQLVARALEPPEGSGLAGHPLSLLAALAVVRDAAQQQAVVHAYWDSLAAVARYNLRWRQRAILDRLEPRPADELALRAARASATAAIDEAEIAAIGAQHALAQQGFLSFPSGTLPLPSDRPCAGPYETRYEHVFAGRPAPAHAWLIDRTLPLRRAAIDHRAGAVEAATQQLAASQRAYRLGSADLENVLAALAGWAKQENAFIRSVCDYNHDIADYATAALVGPADSTTLVSMLIGRQREPVAKPLVPVDGATSTGHPIPAGPSPWSPQVPTLAPGVRPVRQAGNLEPTRGAPGQAALPGDASGNSRPTTGAAPNLLPVDDELVPIAPRGQTAPAQGDRPAQPAEDEAPKVRVVPVER